MLRAQKFEVKFPDGDPPHHAWETAMQKLGMCGLGYNFFASTPYSLELPPLTVIELYDSDKRAKVHWFSPGRTFSSKVYDGPAQREPDTNPHYDLYSFRIPQSAGTCVLYVQKSV